MRFQPKMRVNLGFFAPRKIMNICISQKIKGMHVFNVEYHMCDGFEDKNQSTQNSGYPHIFSKFRTYNVKARGACLYSKLQPRVRMTESLFFYQYLRTDCPLSVQVFLCTLGAKCGWYEANFVWWKFIFYKNLAFLPS